MKNALLFVLALFALLHTDVWWWNDAQFVFGLPIALSFHVIYCFVAAGLMMLLVRFAWPDDLEPQEG